MQIIKNKAVKRNQISPETKLEIIEKNQNGKTSTEIAIENKLVQLTISTNVKLYRIIADIAGLFFIFLIYFPFLFYFSILS